MRTYTVTRMSRLRKGERLCRRCGVGHRPESRRGRAHRADLAEPVLSIAAGNWTLTLQASRHVYRRVPEVLAVRALATGQFEIRREPEGE